jgi:glycosyltransferase involved in cell wall biosynthesis
VHIAVEGSTWINPRGYGRFTRECIRALLRQPSEHTFTLVLDSGAASASDLPNTPRIVVPTRSAVADAATANGRRSLADIWRMSAALSSRRFDAVLFPTSYSFVPVGPGPFVMIVVHDALPETMPKLVLGSWSARIMWGLKTRLACWRADEIATVSEASARAIRRHLPIGSRSVRVLTEGTAPIFSPERTDRDAGLVRACVPRQGPFLLYVGGLSPHKRVPDLIRAFGAVATRGDHHDLSLVIVGPGDADGFEADRSGIAAALSDIGHVRDRVLPVGFVPDTTLAALYRSAVCTVLPSAAEGFGLPALEAMVSGCPLVVARNAALEEVCADAAEYVAHPAELGQAIERVLDDPVRRVRLRERGMARSRHFGWDECARRVLGGLTARVQAV